MIIRVDAAAALPVYEQIRQQVTRMAVVGTLAVGSRLPTIRQLAADLGIAKGTVAKAYTLLESSAIVESRGHRGTFVLAPPSTVSASAVDAMSEAAQAYVVSSLQAGQTLDDAIAALRGAWQTM